MSGLSPQSFTAVVHANKSTALLTVHACNASVVTYRQAAAFRKSAELTKLGY